MDDSPPPSPFDMKKSIDAAKSRSKSDPDNSATARLRDSARVLHRFRSKRSTKATALIQDASDRIALLEVFDAWDTAAADELDTPEVLAGLRIANAGVSAAVTPALLQRLGIGETVDAEHFVLLVQATADAGATSTEATANLLHDAAASGQARQLAEAATRRFHGDEKQASLARLEEELDTSTGACEQVAATESARASVARQAEERMHMAYGALAGQRYTHIFVLAVVVWIAAAAALYSLMNGWAERAFFLQHLGACRRRTPRTRADLQGPKRCVWPRPFRRHPPIRSSPLGVRRRRAPKRCSKNRSALGPSTAPSTTPSRRGSRSGPARYI